MPNKNAFLAVVLDEAILASLSHAIDALVADPSGLLSDGSEAVSFVPVDAESRHMTFVYFGEHLRNLPAQELRSFHTALCAEVSAHAATGAPMTFSEFMLFPPGKMNLVIARFEPSEPLLQLRRAVLSRAKEQPSLPKTLFDLLEEDGDWMPHVTLGKIRATKAQIGKLSCARTPWQNLAPAAAALPQGLTLLGDRPPRAWCDWDDALAFGTARAGEVAVHAESLLAVGPGIAPDSQPAEIEVVEQVGESGLSQCCLPPAFAAWLRQALPKELEEGDAECMFATAEVILTYPEDLSEALAEVQEIFRGQGARQTAGDVPERWHLAIASG